MKAEGGRYPMGLMGYDKDNIRVTARKMGDVVRIRIDDIANISRWEELSITIEELRTLLES